jgi:hypothetical protein
MRVVKPLACHLRLFSVLHLMLTLLTWKEQVFNIPPRFSDEN